MKTNLFWMVGLTLMLGCPSDDGPSGDTEDGTSTGPTSSASGSASASGSSTTPGTDSMSGTTEDPGTTSIAETGTGTTDEPTTAATEPDTDGTGSGTGSGSGSGDSGTTADCVQYDNQKECEADKACEWLGQGDVGICSDPENPPCDMIPVMFCDNVDGCMVADKMCVPE